MKTFAKIAVVTAGALASLSVMAAFSKDMTAAQIDSEVQQSLKNGQSLASIVGAASKNSVCNATLVSSLISQGQNAASVVGEATKAGCSANMAVSAAVAAGANYDDVLAAALSNGADPTSITPPTAAGRGNGPNPASANPGQNNPNSPPSFSNAPASTPAGGGGGGVSRS